MFESLFATTGISLERLRTLCLIVTHGTIAKAAEAAGGDANTASLYSRQIKELESFVGAKLLTRKGKTVQPTRAGRELAANTGAFFQSIEDIRTEAEDGVQRIRVGAGEAPIQWLVFPRLLEMRKAYPSALYEFENLRTSEIHRGLEQARLDLGVVRSSSQQKGFEYAAFGTLEFGFFVPEDLVHQDAKDPLRILKRIPLGTLSGGGDFNRRLARALGDTGINPHIGVRTESFPMLKEVLKANPMAAFLPIQAEPDLKTQGYRMFRVPEFDFLQIPYSLVYHLGNADIRQSIRRVALKWGMAKIEPTNSK